MKKTLTLSALLLAMAAGIAHAGDAAPAAPNHDAMRAERMEHMKEKMGEMHAKRDAAIAERRGEWDAKRKDCDAKMQAAATPEAMKAVHQDCKAEGKALHDKFQAERKEKMGEMKEKRGEWKAKREEMKGKMHEGMMKGPMGAPAAPAAE